MKEKSSIWYRMNRLSALLMAVLVLSISVIQIFHSHDHGHYTTGMGATEYTQAISECPICDFLVHSHQEDFILPEGTTVQIPQVLSIRKPVEDTVNFYNFKLPGFTNKGPPIRATIS